MNGKGQFSAERACELVLHKIKQYQLDYDIHETPDSVVIFIRKRFIEDQKKESRAQIQHDEENIKMLSYEKEFPTEFKMNDATKDAKHCEKCAIRNIDKKETTKLREDLSNKQKENNNLENDIKRCQTEIIYMLKKFLEIK